MPRHSIGPKPPLAQGGAKEKLGEDAADSTQTGGTRPPQPEALLHDLSEALTAIGLYTGGIRTLLSRSSNPSRDEMNQLIITVESLSGQTRRASDDLHHLRAAWQKSEH